MTLKYPAFSDHIERDRKADWSNSVTNQRAETWLRNLGFECEEEPSWVGGQKPDFFCKNGCELWIEVKTLGPHKRSEQLGDVHVELRDRLDTISANATAFAWVHPPLEARDAKTVTRLAARELQRADFGAQNARHLILVPEQPSYHEFVRFAFQTYSGRLVVSAVGSKTGSYGWPAILEPKSYTQVIYLIASDGKIRKCRLRDIATFSENFRAAIELSVHDGAFAFLGTAPARGAEKLTTVERIRDTVKEANAQSKNGCQCRSAAALTIIYHDDVFVADDLMLVSALYGDLSYTFSPSTSESGQLSYMRNGVFGPNKNSTTSAVCYVPNGAEPLIVHNLWAANPLSVTLLSGRHIIPQSDGTFKEIRDG